MANTCSYIARICGERQDVIDFLWWLVGRGPLFYSTEQGKWEPGYVGRIGHWESPVCYRNKNGSMMVEIDDYCAWSFLATGVEGGDDSDENHKSVPDLCRIYDIQFELFSEETGTGFDEYYFFDGQNEKGDREEEFNHDDVTPEMEKEWKIIYSKDICWRWVKENGERHKEIRDKDEVFLETKDKLFPHKFRELNGAEWELVSSKVAIRLDAFCQLNNNSWFIPWQEYDKRARM